MEKFFEFNPTRTRHDHSKKWMRYKHKTDMLKNAYVQNSELYELYMRELTYYSK